MCNAIADAKLWWEPGTKVGYHAYTFGYIVGEIVRRATGKPISQVLREERALSQAMPRAQLRTLEGQAHAVNPEVLAPMLVEFFTS